MSKNRSTCKQKSHSSQATTPHIVVFGQTGTGKSSLVNLLAGKEIAKVSSQAAGCTSTIQEYRIPSDVGDIYKIWDTPGLNEGEAGNVPDQEAFKQLYSLVNRWGSDIHLIVYCIRGSRLTDMARVNYDLFYGIICEGKVPIVLVVTGLELGNEMDQWWGHNVKLIERMGMAFEGHACVTTTKGSGGIYEDKFRVSQDRVWALLKEHGNGVSWTPGQKWLAEVPHKMDAYMKEYSLRTGQERKLIPMVERRARRQQTLPTYDPPKSPVKHNVVIFGESGSGKSSLVNMIIGQDVATVSNGPMGCTFENESYETRIDGIPYHIYDTVGLNEGEEGRVPHWKAIQGLYTLIRKLDGVSLLIFCIRGRIKDNAHANWLIFFDAICDKKVPVIVVSTCREHEENLEATETQVWEALQKYKMVPDAVACVVSIWGRNNEYEGKYQLSQQRLRTLTVQHRLREPWCKDKNEWFAQLYQKTFDLRLCFLPKSRLQFVEKMRGPLEDFKKNGSLKEDDMDTLTKILLQAERKITKKRF